MSKPAYDGDKPRSGWQARSKQNKPGVRDKMQPSLLDRLTDNQPQNRQEAVNSTLISHSTLRRQVLRDLQWLFNTINHDGQQTLLSLDHVRSSVVNFGIAPLAGMRMSDIEWQDIQHKITEAIINFEPRILPQELQVRCISDTQSLDLYNILSVEIKGHLRCEPYPLEFLFRSDVDLENGYFELKDAG